MFDNVEPENVWNFCLKNDWKDEKHKLSVRKMMSLEQDEATIHNNELSWKYLLDYFEFSQVNTL